MNAWLTPLITVLFTSGGILSATAIRNWIILRRKGKVETEDNIIKRMERQSVSDFERTRVAELRADRAEEETIAVRKQLFASEERAEYFRRFIVGQGFKPPKWPPDYGSEDDEG